MIVQKYREIYGNVARRQIAKDEEGMVVIMREKRLAEPHKRHYKAIMNGFVAEHRVTREEGKFIWLATYEQLGFDF